MQLHSTLEFAERTNLQGLRFVFGHYVHESLFSVFADREIFLFTGMRSPIERAVSEFYHICRVLSRSGKAPITADEFFKMRTDTMCAEIIRAFPTLARQVNGSIADKAIAICQMFDLIYDADTFENSLEIILKHVGVSADNIRSLNVRSEESNNALLDIEAEIRQRAPFHFSGDQKLFDAIRPALGKVRPFRRPDKPLSVCREEWQARIRLHGSGFALFSDHLARYCVADYLNLGRKDELHKLMEQKAEWLSRLTETLQRRDG